MATRCYAVAVSGDAKILLDAACALTQESASAVVRKALAVYVGALPDADRVAIEAIVNRASRKRNEPAHQPTRPRPAPKEVYAYSRLCFKRDRIESLQHLEDEFQVRTPFGTFQISKAEFFRDFPKVRKSKSYQRAGYYTYPVLPARAEQYRVSDQPAAEIGPDDRSHKSRGAGSKVAMPDRPVT
jgi:hypothetical protein